MIMLFNLFNKSLIMLLPTVCHYYFDPLFSKKLTDSISQNLFSSLSHPIYRIRASISTVFFAVFSCLYMSFMLYITKVPLLNQVQLRMIGSGLGSGLILGIVITGVVTLIINAIVCVSPNSQNRNGAILMDFLPLKAISFSFLWLPVVFMQSACEEIVFRLCMINYFSCFGFHASILLSTTMFIVRDTNFVCSRSISLFPLLSSAVIGLIHGYLYSMVHSIWPCIISRVVVYFLIF